MEEMQSGFSQRCVTGGKEAAAQADTRKAQVGGKEKAQEDSPAVELGPGEVGPPSAWGGFTTWQRGVKS